MKRTIAIITYFLSYDYLKSIIQADSVFSSIGEKDGVTQFQRVINAFGTETNFASSLQAKGRLERENQIFQERVIKDAFAFVAHIKKVMLICLS